MICPNEGSEIHAVKISAHYERPLILEQCMNCGGIWFDESELYYAKHGEAQKIEALNMDALRQTTLIQNNVLKCPKDKTALVRFNDRYFPAEIIIEKCHVCNCFWLNRGEFTKYQNFREERRKPKKANALDKKFDTDVKRLLAQHKQDGVIDALGKLGRFLSQPIDRYTITPLEPEKNTFAENLILNVILTILK